MEELRVGPDLVMALSKMANIITDLNLKGRSLKDQARNSTRVIKLVLTFGPTIKEGYLEIQKLTNSLEAIEMISHP